MSDPPGRIGRYRIEGVLGRGAMGIIYKAHDPEIDRAVAIKLIRADLLEGEQRTDYIARFRREAQAAGRCAHPNIVAIYDLAMYDGNPFLAMEFVDGISLRDARQRGTVFDRDGALAIIFQVLEALGAAHRLGVIHRDIKPANILLAGGGPDVKVADFGISRIESAELTQGGAVVGTPSYMSPEQCQGLPTDARTDLFSAAVVLYEMLAGERPFPGRTYEAAAYNLVNSEPPDLSARNFEVSPALWAAIARALSKSPAARFATAADMAAALRAAADTQSIALPPAPAGDQTLVLPRAAPEAASDEPASRLDERAAAMLERKLARIVGPIARVLVRNAIRQAETPEAVVERLAASIEHVPERTAFQNDALAALRRSPELMDSGVTRTIPGQLPAEELLRAQQALARFIGPVAGLLVKRTAAVSTSVPELWERLGAHIEREDHRRAFLDARLH